MTEFGGMVAARLSISLNVRSVNHEIVSPPANGSISRRSSSAQYWSTGEFPTTTATDFVFGSKRNMLLRKAGRSRSTETAVSCCLEWRAGRVARQRPLLTTALQE